MEQKTSNGMLISIKKVLDFNLGLMAIERLKPVDKEKILEIGLT